MGTAKLQLFSEQPLMRKTRIHQKRSPTTEDIKRWLGGAESQYSQEPHPRVGDIQTVE